MTVGRTASATHPGRRRRRNEDVYICEPPLFAVADGMGGAQAGEVAARVAAAALRERRLEGAPPEEQVRALIQEANRRVHRRSSEDEAASGMGTTTTVALVGDGRVTIGHVGDSRAYLFRGGALEQVTDDHSLVAELVRSGKLSPEEADTHPQRSVITRVLGTDPDVDVDLLTIEARPGDVFLLCSDGLSTMVDEDGIRSIVERRRGDLDAAVRELVEAANRAGGEDNITVVAFEIESALDDTSEIPAAPGAAPPDEEDTLTGAERVPTIDEPVPVTTDGAGPAAEWERWDEPELAERRARRRRRLAVGLVVLLVALAVAGAAALWALSRAHFVGAEPDGQLAVYQGVPYEALGIRLYRSVYISDRVAAGHLSRAERVRLFDHDLTSRAEAEARIRAFEPEVIP